jgi:glutamate synthase (NADPH/NADH) small chain
VGRDVPFASLLQNFDAVFLGTGAYTEVDGGLPGSGLGGVQRALPFLIANARRLLGGMQDPAALPDLAGKRVVVLGGGDTAMDCVRSSIRLGAEEVRCVYRRDEANMPGSKREVKYARDEGVQFLFNRQPMEIIGDANGVRGVRVVTTELIADAGGRARPQVIAGSEETIAADVVLLAFGFQASPAPWFGEFGIAMHANGRLRVGEGALAYQTSNPKVFAGGDNVRGADLVVRAVLDGRDGAEAMLRHLATLPAASAVSVAA